MKCPACQTENRDGAKFCDECGAPLPSSQSSPILTDGETSHEEREADAFFEQDHDPTSEIFAIDESDIVGDDRERAHIVSENDSEKPADVGDHRSEKMGEAKLDSAKTCDLSGLKQMVDAEYSSYEDGAEITRKMEAVGRAATTAGADGQNQARSYIANDEKKAKRKGHKKHVRRVAIAAVAVVAVVALAVGVTYSMELWGGKTIPDVAGESQANATYVLEERGFVVKTSTVKSDDVEGIVLLTDPSIGTRAEAGASVVVHISAARVVPDLVGKMRNEAESLLSKEGFRRVSYVEFKSDEPAGTVLEVSPEAGTKGKAALPINVSVAVPYTVPHVAGMSSEDAQSAIANEGYAVNVATVIDDSYTEGCAAYTEPAEGEELKSGETVTVYIAVSRATKFEGMAWDYLTSAQTVDIDGESYEILSVDDVAFTSNSTCEFVITARFVTYSANGIKAESEPQSVRGYITYDDDGSILAIQNASNVF